MSEQTITIERPIQAESPVQDSLIDYISRASEEVKDWPEWKKNLLKPARPENRNK